MSTASPKPWAVLAVPGDIETRTGGYLYDRQVLAELRAAGHSVPLLSLPAAFPYPSSDQMAEAGAALAAVPAEVPIVLDGLAGGAIDTTLLAAVRAPIIALTHHPLAFETGLDPDEAERLLALERANLACAAAVIVTSPHTAMLLSTHYDVAPDRITVAEPSPIVRATPTDRPRPEGPPHILCVGSLSHRKGQDVLLDALGRVADLPWQATLVGRAHEPGVAEALTAQAHRLGLSHRVTFAGELGAEALTRLYEQASLFALASRFEGYGMAFAEALAAGLPVVGCATGAVPETVPKDAGRLVPPDDAVAFADALRALLEAPDLRATYASAARRHAATLPTWADTARRIARVIDRVRETPPNASAPG